MDTPAHIEDAPRMWDKSIAASLINNNNTNTARPATGTVNDANSLVDVSLVARLKPYLIPVMLIGCVLVVVYVLWKYFTKYRKAKGQQCTSRH